PERAIEPCQRAEDARNSRCPGPAAVLAGEQLLGEHRRGARALRPIAATDHARWRATADPATPAIPRAAESTTRRAPDSVPGRAPAPRTCATVLHSAPFRAAETPRGHRP